VTSDDLTRAQAEAMLASVRRQLRYLGKLRDRMNGRGFQPNDPLYLAATGAFNAVHALSVELHYLTCAPGTAGKRAKFELKEGEMPGWIRAQGQ
jgi:hypothetical protein